MALYWCVEDQRILNEDELRIDFDQFKAEQPMEFDYSFAEYLRNCLAKNGSLYRLEDHRRHVDDRLKYVLSIDGDPEWITNLEAELREIDDRMRKGA